MRSFVCLIIVVFFFLFFLSFPFMTPSAAINEGPAASGSFQFFVDDGPIRNIEFDARTTNDGRTTGEVMFRDTAPVSAQSTSDAGETQSSDQLFSLRAQLDCLMIKGNKAVMSGTVTESNLQRYLGSRLLLVAQDNNATNANLKDKLTWGVYRPMRKDWIPIDSERPDEPAPALVWVAKDAERPDDEGTQTGKNEEIGCQTFPLSSFSFIDPKYGQGSIQVRP